MIFFKKIDLDEFYHSVINDDGTIGISTFIDGVSYMYDTDHLGNAVIVRAIWNSKTIIKSEIISKEELTEHFKVLLRKEKILKIKEKI
jgi:hypothetical protein